MNSSAVRSSAASSRFVLLILAGCLAVVLGFIFSSSFRSEQALFANDGPLGAQASRIYELPTAFFGIWSDQYWLGGNGGNYLPNFTGMLLWLLGPIWFNKLYVPAALLILGLSAGYYFKRLGFRPAVCVLGGLAAALNMNFFSNACWGLASRATCLAAIFLALAAVQAGFATHSGWRRLMLTALAGLGIGLAISEGGDNGAVFAVYVGSLAFFQYLFSAGSVGWRVLKGAGVVVVMVVFSLMLAAQTLNIFISTSVKGIVGVQATDAMTPEQKWAWATQWSLPPVETLRVVVPGLFGYRLDTPNGGNYWGGVGRDLAYDQTKQGFPRHSGAGEYAGVLVVLAAAWGFANSLRQTDSAFSATERKMIWFWGGGLALAMVLSWGYHAPLYQFVYKLPFFSTIRNPMKFMHAGHLCLMILFAYGLQGIWRRYLGATVVKAGGFEKKWLIGSLAAVGVGLLGLVVFTMASGKVSAYLDREGFTGTLGRQMVRASTHEVMLAVVFLVISVAMVLMIQKGVFAGARAKWAGVVLGLVLVLDLARADMPWIKYYDYQEKYASNAPLEVLAAKPHEGRVSVALSMGVTQEQFEALQRVFQFTQAWQGLQQVYQMEWLQHQFPFYNIQALDQPQEPRLPAEKKAYRDALNGKLARLYELTNTRYLAGLSGNFTEAMNQVFDAQKRRFRQVSAFDFVRVGEEGVGAQPNPAGQFALIEFTGALPRVKLYSSWEVSTNAPATLGRLADAAFDPQQMVIVADPVPAPVGASNVASRLTADITSYAPKRIEVRTEVSAAAVLLMNNKWDEGWNVTVDGKPAELLRCNFMMQGVYLPANSKSVVFRYQPRSTIFFISLGAVVLGVALCGLLAVFREEPAEDAAPEPAKLKSKTAKP